MLVGFDFEGARKHYAAALLIACGLLIAVGSQRPIYAAVATSGNVTPAPPAGGGNIAGPLFIGDTSFGTMTINNGTPLNITGASATIGDDATAIGIVAITGLGSDLTTGNDLVIGNLGTGFASVASFAKITFVDDLLMAVGDGSSGTLTVTNLGSIVDVTDAVLVGSGGTGAIEVSNGGRLLADDTVLGGLATGEGRVSLRDLTTLWQQDNSMTIGDAGKGILEISNQARLETTNAVIANATTSFGRGTLTGAGSAWDVTGFINVGVSGTATLRVLDGARLTNTGAARLATGSNGETQVEVSGAGSLWSTGTFLGVGDFGFATLQVTSGGRVSTSGDVVLGDNAGSRGEVTVDGAGSVLETTGLLDVSQPGEATLTISNGGLVKSAQTTTVRAAGTLVLDGGRLEAGSATGLSNQGLVIGGGTIANAVTNTATGRMQVDPGDHLVIRSTLNTAGVIAIDGGEFDVLGNVTNTGDIDVRWGTLRFLGASGLANSAGSQLAAVGGDVDIFGVVTNAAGSQMIVGGESNVALHDNFTNNGALLITPGSELLTLEDLSFSAGSSLNLEIAGDDPVTGFGRVHTGSATLAGTLDIDLANSFAPTLGDTFTVLTSATALSGTFAATNLPALGAGLGWDIDYEPMAVVLSVVAAVALPGDYNQNGVVDAADYVVYRNTLGQTGTGLPADGNNNGQVDTGDLTVWQANFGKTAGSGSTVGSAASVPEPAGLALVAVMLIMGAARGRQR
jgi:T5SS/PEP-CTERM-associated repeat protein